MKQYPIVCPSCVGTGQITTPSKEIHTTNALSTIICPACNGSGTVICTKTK